MELYVLDSNWNTIGSPIDAWTSLLWYLRYNSAGECSLYLPADLARREELALGNFLYCPRFPEDICEITTLEIHRDPFAGSQLIVGGVGLSGVLRRRIVLDKYIADGGTVQSIIQDLLNQNIISPSNSKRAVPNFTFEINTDVAVATPTASVSFEGNNLYDAIEELCGTARLGFKVIPVAGGGLKFKLYAGVDRSYSQSVNPCVVFSDEYGNLGESIMTRSNTNLRNVICVRNVRSEYNAGSGKTVETRTNATVYDGTEPEGLDRREEYLSSSTSNKDTSGNEMSASEYQNLLQNEGAAELAQRKISAVFSGNADAVPQWAYGTDYFLGDIVQISDEYGQEATTRIAEMVFTSDQSGETLLPTFLQDEGVA